MPFNSVNHLGGEYFEHVFQEGSGKFLFASRQLKDGIRLAAGLNYTGGGGVQSVSGNIGIEIG